jgi:SAM-dependent methyltransferase
MTVPFPGSASYWQSRYVCGGNSGVGSYSVFAEFKAEVLNSFVAEHEIRSVIEFGCGDGNQLSLAAYPEYLGFDVSEAAVDQCRERFQHDTTKAFMLADQYAGERAELALSLDVIYHLVEDDVFDAYMRRLFGAATRYVGIYSSNRHDTGDTAPHVRHRRFTDWTAEHAIAWRPLRRIPNRYPYRGDYRTGSWSEFFFYEVATQ